jgi:ABC-type amino acid transport substrate-binding protein
MFRSISLIAACAALFVAADASAQELRGALKRIKESGTITLGVREASTPFSFRGSDGNPQGYSVEMCNVVVESLRTELKAPRLKVRYVYVTPETRIAAARDGKVDLECGSTTHTMTRRKQVDFSLPIFVDGAAILSRAAANIVTVRDLQGKRVAVLERSSTEAALQRVQQSLGISFAIERVRDHDFGLKRLETEDADAYVTDRSILFDLAIKATDFTKLSLGQEFLSYEPYAIMMRRDADLRLAVDRALARTFGTGKAVEIFQRWFGNTPPSGPLAAMFVLNGYPE